MELPPEDSHFLELGHDAFKDESLGVCFDTETVDGFILRGLDQDPHLHGSPQDRSCPIQNPKGEDPIPGGRRCSQLEPVPRGQRDCSVHGAETDGEFVLQEPDQDLNLLRSRQDCHSPQNLKGDGLGGGLCCSQLEPFPRGRRDCSVHGAETAGEFALQEPDQDLNLLRSRQDRHSPQNLKGDGLGGGPCCSKLEQGPKELKDGSVCVCLSHEQLAVDLHGQEVLKNWSLLNSTQDYCGPRPAEDQNGDALLPEVSFCRQFEAGRHVLKDTFACDGRSKADIEKDLCFQEHGRDDLSLAPNRPRFAQDHRADFPEGPCCLELVSRGLGLDVVVEQGQESGVLGDVLAVRSLHEEKCGPSPVLDHRVDDLLPESRSCSRSEPRHSGLEQSSFCVRLSRFVERDGQVSVRYRELKPQNYSADAPDLDCEEFVFKKLSNIRAGQTSKNYRARSSPAANSCQGTHELPRIVKHKQSSITFSDYAENRADVYGSLDDGESSGDQDAERADGEGDGDDDVFLERRVHRWRKRQSDCSRRSKAGDACHFEAEPDSRREEQLSVSRSFSSSLRLGLLRADASGVECALRQPSR
ncbi:uncharacterized protein LOC127608544 [Hippocampus zosterae]|uniref:uncharacterized protein LOC127608544 n=1 Tax=Hippocampus zosterae TaxID=109293 RepID=UPI00223CF7D2|nr:uncharacterized protein LOC127608544 [Hippocampus zosterae]